MRQVPQYLLLGNGSVAKHFQHYFSLLNIQYNSWHREFSLNALEQSLYSATHVLVLISDNAIESFIYDHLHHLSDKKTIIHCSGSLISDSAYGAHPLMSFADTLYEVNQYKTIPFVIDDDAPSFSTLLPGLPNPHIRLSKSLKAKYHALCVLSGNFSCLLWQKLFDDFENELSIPKSIAHPYLIQQMQNLLINPKNALTGPLVRNDTTTIEKNLIALTQDPFKEIYKSFVSCYKLLEKRG